MESNWAVETVEAWEGLTLVMQSTVGVSWCLAQEMIKNDNTKASQYGNFNVFFIRESFMFDSPGHQSAAAHGDRGLLNNKLLNVSLELSIFSRLP
jgi:hypothetical protein